MNDGFPPPSVEDLKSRWEVVGTLFIIVVVRVLFLMAERYSLRALQLMAKSRSGIVVPYDSDDSDEEQEVVGRNVSKVADAASSVFEGATPLFLFVSFMTGVSGCTLRTPPRVFMILKKAKST